MVESLGARLVRAGLVTRELLAAANAQSAHRGTGLAEALVACGLSEDALAGYMLADGHGPLLEARVLAGAERDFATRVGRAMAEAFLALPVRSSSEGVVVAMADPSDEHALRELRFRLASPVVAKVARVGELRVAIAETLPDAPVEPAPPELPSMEIPLVREKARITASDSAAVPSPAIGGAVRKPRADAPRRAVVASAPVPFALPDKSLEDQRWDEPAQPQAAARAPEASHAPVEPATSTRVKFGPKAPVPGAAAPPGDIGSFLAALRAAVTRDEALRIACEGALTVGGTAVFLGVRKGELVGWEGLGPGVSRDALRNLWLPITSASVMKRVLDSGAPHYGPHGAAPADQVFRAATGCRSAKLAAHPVYVGAKPLGVLCVDGPRYAEAGQERLAVLTHALGEALKRLILTRKG